MKTHKDLDVWQASIKLAGQVYEITKDFPKDELFGLVSQMRRAAVSIASNIAEGAARHGNREFIQFLRMALGSASELDTQIEISKTVGICDGARLADLQEQATRVSMMLNGLIRSVQRRGS